MAIAHFILKTYDDVLEHYYNVNMPHVPQINDKVDVEGIRQGHNDYQFGDRAIYIATVKEIIYFYSPNNNSYHTEDCVTILLQEDEECFIRDFLSERGYYEHDES